MHSLSRSWEPCSLSTVLASKASCGQRIPAGRVRIVWLQQVNPIGVSGCRSASWTCCPRAAADGSDAESARAVAASARRACEVEEAGLLLRLRFTTLFEYLKVSLSVVDF